MFAAANIVMEPITSAIAAWLGEWATVAIAGKVLEGVKPRFSADEWGRSLKQAIQETQAKNDRLFAACRPGGLHGVPNFLQDFFQSGEVLRELQKPLQDIGKPSVDILCTAFEQQAQDHPNLKDYKPDWLKPWMTVLVDRYFDQIKGICFRVAKAEYLQQLAQRVDDIKFVGIAVPGEEVEKQENLAKIFVMPTVQEVKRELPLYSEPADIRELRFTVTFFEDSTEAEPSTHKQDQLLREQRAWALRDRQGAKFPAQKLLGRGKQRAVLLGAPGSGKSTLLNYFALRCCPQMLVGQQVDDKLPIVVRIRDWILQPELGLLAYLRWYAERSLAVKNLPTGFFEHWLERGQALILLDGLDEVPDEALRRRVVEQIETFLSQYGDNTAVITSRPAGYRWDFFDATEFPHYTLEPFDDKQIAEFIDHWYTNRVADKAEAERRKADLRKALKGTDRIQQLAKNPLLLTIIALIHRYQAALPRQRYKLYEKAVETLLTSWDSGRELKLFEQVLQYLKPDDLLYVLKKLAYWIHTQGSTADAEGGTLIDQADLIWQLSQEIRSLKGCKPHEAKAEAERFVDFIQKRTGLVNEQGRECYAFVHKTFQEYLTAEEIYDQFEEGEDGIIQLHIQKYLHQQHWREVLLLLVSKLKKKRAADAIRSIYKASSKYEQWLHRDLLFAGWCLTEDPQGLKGADTQLTQNILDGLVSLEVIKLEQVGRKVKNNVAQIIHRLGETSFETDTWERLQQHSEHINQFRLLEFQASLSQEQAALSTLLDLLNDEDSDVRFSAASSLGQLGNASDAVVNTSLGLLNDEEWHMRYRAGTLLGRLGNVSDAAVSALLGLLNDEELYVRSRAATSLGQLSKKSDVVVNALLGLLNDEHSDVRSRATELLGQLGNASDAVVNALLDLLNDEDSDVRFSASASLIQLSNTSDAVVNALLDLLNDEDSDMRFRVAESLIQLDNASDTVVNTLLDLLNDEDSYVRYRAAASLGRLGNDLDAVVNTLLGLLNDEDSDVRSRATASLGHLGNASDTVVNTLLGLLNDEDSDVRYRAAVSLEHLGNASDAVVNTLLGLLNDEDSDVRYRAAVSLGHLGNASDAVVNTVLGLLNDEDSDVRYHAAELLGQLGNTSDEVVNALLGLLNDEDSYVRSCVAELLGQLGNASDEVVNALLGLLKDEEPYVHSLAVASLGQLSEKSDQVKHALVQWLEQHHNSEDIGEAIDLWQMNLF
jgi:HEAT repeat protein